MRKSALLVLAISMAGCVLATSLTEMEHVALPPGDSVSMRRALEAVGAQSPAAPFTAGLFHGGGQTLPYRLLTPVDSASSNRYPLVLVLHGSGAIGTDNEAQLGVLARSWAMPEIKAAYPAYVVVPHFDDRSSTYITDARDSLPASEATERLRTAVALVDQLVATKHIDRKRVYAVGFSMGASAAWDLAVERPGFFAGIVPIAGIPPRRAQAASMARTPVYIVHGNADTENPIAADRAMFKALGEANATNVHFREYARLGHVVPPEFLTDTTWRSWLFAQGRH